MEVRGPEEEPLVLTAAHVVGSLSRAHGRDPIEVLLRKGPAIGSGDVRLGRVVCSDPPEPTDQIAIDASLIAVDSGVKCENRVRRTTLPRSPVDLDDLPLDDPVIVHKRGMVTPNLTSGLLDPHPETLIVDVPGTGTTATYLKGYFVRGTDTDHPFARPGDSGAIVIDDDDCVIGMVVALVSANPQSPSPDDPAFVVAMSDIVTALDIGLPGPTRPCTLR